jgi:hypothetical protein
MLVLISNNLIEAKIVFENWRIEFNTVWLHRGLDYHPPEPEPVQPLIFDPYWFTSEKSNVPIS